MKKRFVLAIILLVLLIVYTVKERTVMFVYTNPYIETSGFQYIAKTLKGLDNALNVVRNDAKASGHDFDYLYINAYGSGFLKNNPIPNDLDTAVGIYLGEYDYNGKNGKEIAKVLIDKMTAFQYSFLTYIDSLDNKDAYIGENPFMLLSKFTRVKEVNIESISSALENVIKDKDYVAYTGISGTENAEILPYVMKSNEVLLKNYVMLHILSSKVSYNKTMPVYQREISLIPEFYFNLKSGDTVKMVEIVPEIALGRKVQLSRNFFASSVYVNNYSSKFIKKLPYLVEDDKYFAYRMFTYNIYFQDVLNAGITDKKPVKHLKRIMQTADMISPMIGDKMYQEISEFVNENLSNRDIQLLNEYTYACDMILLSTKNYKLYAKFKRNGEMNKFLNAVSQAADELEMRGEIDKDAIKQLKDFRKNEIENLAKFNDEDSLNTYKLNVFNLKYDSILDIIGKAMGSQIQHKEKVAEYMKMFKKIYTDAGFHEITCVLLDKNTVGILADNYTKSIKDLKKFAKENNIVDVEVKLIDKIPADTAGYKLWASEQRNNVYKQLYEVMIEDKKNFKVKRKLILF